MFRPNRPVGTLTTIGDARSNRRFDLASAQAAAAREETALWVGDFLASAGSNNATLAAALAQRRHWWLGPIRVPHTAASNRSTAGSRHGTVLNFTAYIGHSALRLYVMGD